ncbi:hypothetical protein VRRI112168_00155 [Vreelandella rituensis]|nr:hypothetical protein [Halomonas rituensis]
MLNHNIDSRAILLHQNTQTNSVEITSHDIIALPHKGQGRMNYTLGAGQVFGHEQKQEFCDILLNEREQQGLNLLPDHLLAKTPYALVWWMPPQVRELSFMDKKGSPITFTLKVPGVVAAMCRGTLYFAAFKGAKRPSADTPLYRVPLPNLIGDFKFCMGNCTVPRDAAEAHIPAWEAFLWESRNNHLGREPLKGISSLDDYLDLLGRFDGTKRFPTAKLVATDATLGRFLNALERQG